MVKSSSKSKQPLLDQPFSFKQLIAQYISFLEVTLHCLLHARQIYPPAVFVRRSKYCVAVQRAEHPGVISYIAKVLELLKRDLEKGAAVRLVWVAMVGKEELLPDQPAEKGEVPTVGKERREKGQGRELDLAGERQEVGHGRRAMERWVFDFDDLLGLGRMADEWAKTEPVQNGLTPARLEPLFQHLLVQIVGEAGALPSIPPSDDLSFALIIEYPPSAPPDPLSMTDNFVSASSAITTEGIKAALRNEDANGEGEDDQIWIKGVETGLLDMEVVVQRFTDKEESELRL